MVTGQAGGPGTGLGGSSAQTKRCPVQHSRCEHRDVHVQEAGQQGHGQNQEDDSPEAPVGGGTHQPHRQARGGGTSATCPTPTSRHPSNSFY